MDRIADALGVSTGVVILLAVLTVVQIALQVFSLIDLARRPAVVGGKKWVWLLVILFVNLIGAILYLAVGRTPDAPAAGYDDADQRPREPARAADAVDLLYGPKEER